MGTSASSTGPGAGVPFDPPWLDDIVPTGPNGVPPDDVVPDALQPDDSDGEENGGTDQSQAPNQHPEPVAPPARFGSARSAMTNFAKTGREDSFRKAAGHYSRTGMGGSGNVGRRMRASAATGAHVMGVLQTARDGIDRAVAEWVSTLSDRGADAREIANEIVRFAVPKGGSQDEATAQDSMTQALQDLITQDEDIDLLHMDDDQIWSLIETFLGYEAFARLYLDIGQTFENSKLGLSPHEQVARMNEMQSFLRADIATQVEALRAGTPHATSDQLQALLQDAVTNTFAVYEGAI